MRFPRAILVDRPARAPERTFPPFAGGPGRPRPGRGAAARAALVLCLALITGCGASGSVAGYRSSELYDPGIRTLAVPVFENRSFYRGMEFELTEALIKEIEHRTPYKVTRAGGADTILTGEVAAVNERLLSRTLRAGFAQEVQLIATVNFEWKDLRSGEILRKRSRLQASGEFIPTRGVGEPIETARHEAVAELSRAIVAAMQGDW